MDSPYLSKERLELLRQESGHLRLWNIALTPDQKGRPFPHQVHGFREVDLVVSELIHAEVSFVVTRLEGRVQGLLMLLLLLGTNNGKADTM